MFTNSSKTYIDTLYRTRYIKRNKGYHCSMPKTILTTLGFEVLINKEKGSGSVDKVIFHQFETLLV